MSIHRPTPGLPRWETLNSVSAYYYSGAVAAFVRVIFALALFLFTYRGYKNDRVDRWAGAEPHLPRIRPVFNAVRGALGR